MTHTLPFLTGSAQCHPAWRITHVYPVHIRQLRWVYSGKINRRLVYGIYPRISPQYTPAYQRNCWRTTAMLLMVYKILGSNSAAVSVPAKIQQLWIEQVTDWSMLGSQTAQCWTWYSNWPVAQKTACFVSSCVCVCVLEVNTVNLCQLAMPLNIFCCCLCILNSYL